MNSKEYAFNPKNGTILLVADTVAPVGITVDSSDPAGRGNYDCYEFYNAGAETIFLGWGSSSTSAQSACVVPTDDTIRKVVPIPSGAVIVLRFGVGTYFSGITESASANLFITAGEGL